MNDLDRACAAFRTLLEEQQARVAGMTAERADYTNKATVTIMLIAILMLQSHLRIASLKIMRSIWIFRLF